MKKILLVSVIIIILVSMNGCKKEETTPSDITVGGETISNGNMVSYSQNDDGTYSTTDFTYKYCFVLTGRLPNAATDSSYTILTNDKKVTFDEVSKSLYSSNSKDWLNESETIIVDMR